MGLSAHPDTGYTKKNQAVDIAGVMDALKVQKADLVTHDIGNMVGYALAAQYPARITRWAVIDAPLPGIGNWDAIIRSPLLWHFNFRGPTWSGWCRGASESISTALERAVRDPKKIDEETRQHYAALYARPHAMHDAFEQFAAFNQDAEDNKALLAKGGKITMPVSRSAQRKPLAPRWRMTCASWGRMSPAASFRPRVTGSWKKPAGDRQTRHGVPGQMKARIVLTPVAFACAAAYARRSRHRRFA